MEIVARTLGHDAAAELGARCLGSVVAAFERSCYIRLGASLVCLGDAEIGSGPLNVPCDGEVPDWRVAAAVGTRMRVHRGATIIGKDLRVDLSSTPIWDPPPPGLRSSGDIRKGLAILGGLLPATMPTDGLAALLDPTLFPASITARFADPAATELGRWATRITAGPVPDSVLTLVGLGPGLTPSGDDFLGGFLAALRATGRHAHADALWAVIATCGREATNEISLAHLKCAAAGRVAENLHLALEGLLAGDRGGIGTAVSCMSRRAHNSPWDCLAGMQAALKTVPGVSAP